MEKLAIFNLWVDKNNHTNIYTTEGEYHRLLEIKELLCFEFQVLQPITTPAKGAIGLYKNKVLGAYPFRVAIYDQNYTNMYEGDKIYAKLEPQKMFAQNWFGLKSEGKDPHISFTPIIHLIPGLTMDDFENSNKRVRFFRITDSSIWNYFANGKENFESALKSIISNWDSKYYHLMIAQEFADLNARLVQESYLYTLPNPNESDSPDGHGAAVSPFLFHSEQIITKKRKKEYEDFKKMGVDFKDYKWRILLVDDKIDKVYLRADEGNISKDIIIKDRIEHLFGEGTCECVFLKDDKIDNVFDSIQDNNKTKVVILCINTIDKAKLALKNYKFDFILLDYLLDRNDPSNKAEKRHYGYELLTDLDDIIDKDCSDLSSYLHYTDGKQYIVGPSRRYFFMFISAFTTAISERLRLEGFSRSEELWHIAEGACPTNTPELFCYNLQKMLIKRLKDSGIENLSPNKILDTVSYIYCREGGDDSTRKRANEKYQNILSLLYHYNRILEDVEIPTDGKNSWATQGSVLMTKYFINNLKEYGGLLEHLTHLVHLTAFGTARQWPEMWEEYLFFKNQFDSVCEDSDARKELYRAMEKYIIDLKKIN